MASGGLSCHASSAMNDVSNASCEPEPGPQPLEEPAVTGDPRLDAVARLLAIVDRLRDPGGCPWDREQTVASMGPSLTEEAFEALEAIDRGDDLGTMEELGDLLLVITLIARIASETHRFDVAALAGAVSEKLVRRHPHVFGDVSVDGTEGVLRNWEEIKRAERSEREADTSALAGVPTALPALQRADRLAAKAISAGFRWSDDAGAFAKLTEEVAELEATRLEGEVDHAARKAEALVDPGVVVVRDRLDALPIHERDQLAVARVEEDVPDLAALGDLQDVTAHGREAEHSGVERERRVHVTRDETHVGETELCHEPSVSPAQVRR